MTIAKLLNAKEFPFYLYNANGKLIYFENSNGYWIKREYDANGNVIYHEDSDGYWKKYQRDFNGNVIYFEDSSGYIEDNRPKEYTHEELEQILGHKFTIK